MVTVFVPVVTLHTNSVEVHEAHVGDCRPLGICHGLVMLGLGVRVQGVAVTESVSQSTFPGAIKGVGQTQGQIVSLFFFVIWVK